MLRIFMVHEKLSIISIIILILAAKIKKQYINWLINEHCFFQKYRVHLNQIFKKYILNYSYFSDITINLNKCIFRHLYV